MNGDEVAASLDYSIISNIALGIGRVADGSVHFAMREPLRGASGDVRGFIVR